MPFRPESFHGIFCECVLSLVPDKEGCLEGFYRALVPGGRLVLADLVLPRSAGGLCGDGLAAGAGSPATCLDGALTRGDLSAAIEAAGFHITRMADHTRHLKEMACEMVFKHGSLDRFWQELTGTDFHSGLAGHCRAGRLHPGYVMIIAEKSISPHPQPGRGIV